MSFKAEIYINAVTVTPSYSRSRRRTIAAEQISAALDLADRRAKGGKGDKLVVPRSPSPRVSLSGDIGSRIGRKSQRALQPLTAS
jgi:hypothetical protein